MSRREIRITGYGGQGVIMTGFIFGKAAAIYDDLHSTMTQSFGPEARGSACASALIVDDEFVAYPYLRETDVLIALSREGYEKYVGELAEGGTLIYDEDLVHPAEGDLAPGVRKCGVPAVRFAEELGRRIVQNIVVVGFATAATGIVDKEAVKKAVESSVPPATIELNLKAFEKGYEHFNS
ncbi:2-oxoacid:acceptor oxidoreductase family protein [bacterium]|nr:2-oxoacid:acceptor oxidoreductase family protein [bacterium]